MEANAASQLKEIISKHYDIGELREYEQLDRGYVSTSYVIETVINGKKSRYFLRKYRKGIKQEEVEFEHSVIKHLTKKDFGLVARVINTKDGKTYVRQLKVPIRCLSVPSVWK